MKFILSLLLCLFAEATRADDFSFVHIGDFHAGSAIWRTNFQTMIQWVLAHTNDGTLNIRGLISTGDLYEQNTNVYQPGSFGYSPDRLTYIDLTNGLNQLVTNGIKVWPCSGNHDCDTDGLQDWCTIFNDPLAWNNLFPVSWFSNQGGVIGTRVAGDSRNIAITYTNGPVKLLFLTYSSHFTNSINFFPQISPADAVLDQTMWMTNLAAQYPDHNVIVAAHYFLAFSVGASYTPPKPDPYFSYDDGTGYQRIGPGPAPLDQGFRDLPNLLFCLGGHTRSLYKGHISVQANDGHFFDVQCFNTQTDPRNGVWVGILTFRPGLGIVQMSTYDAGSGRMLTNNDAALWKPTAGGGVQTYQHTWQVPLAVPRQKSIFRLTP
jgi:hypothetical protein